MKLICNTVLDKTAVIKITDGSDADQATETATARRISTGPRYFQQVSTGNAARRFCYINTVGGIDIDTCVITRADVADGKAAKILAWSDYPTTSSELWAEATWTPTLLGPLSQDAIIENLDMAASEAVAFELPDTTAPKTVHQIYFGTAFTFSNPRATTFVPLWDRMQVKRQSYLVEAATTFAADNLTRAQLTIFEALHGLTKEPCFLYDSTGILLPGKLWHVVIPGYSVQPMKNDMYSVSFTAYRLRGYDTTV